ncbi:MAG: sensor histidine kinase [Alphaproteobacteria bacterium]|nr:MAG: sensor histidine kinase [Alphaproteobacteria bacterium]
MADERDEDILPPDYYIRPISLRFSNEALERRFAVDLVVRGMFSIRAFLLAGAVLYALFGVLDYHVLPQTVNTIWAIRFGGVIPPLLLIFAATYFPVFIRYGQWFLASAMFIAGFGIIAMVAVAESPGNGLYYAGLIMVVSYCSTLLHIRWVLAAVVAIALVVLYQPVALWINPIPPSMVLSNNFFLGMSTAVGIFASYALELYVRRDYLHTQMLKFEKARSDELLEEAQSASRAKSDFLGVMSHELRTPLNAILGFSEIMQQKMFGPVGSERYAAYVDDIHEAAQHLLNIISDVLDLSKAEVGKLKPVEEEVDVVELLEQSCRLLREQASENGIRLSLEVKGPRPIVHADPRLLKQVAINLLGNAIKFTQSGGSIAVSVRAGPATGCIIQVADTGIGIAEENLEKVLEPFVQVESTFARKYGGTGLGLPLVKRIVELHDGAVKIDSTLGAGTTVTVTLPASRVLRLTEAESGVA